MLNILRDEISVPPDDFFLKPLFSWWWIFVPAMLPLFFGTLATYLQINAILGLAFILLAAAVKHMNMFVRLLLVIGALLMYVLIYRSPKTYNDEGRLVMYRFWPNL